MIRRPPRTTRPATLFPDTTLCRSGRAVVARAVDQLVPSAADAVGRTLGRAPAPAAGGLERTDDHEGRQEHDEHPEGAGQDQRDEAEDRSEEHTSELQSLMRISYAVFCLKKKNKNIEPHHTNI